MPKEIKAPPLEKDLQTTEATENLYNNFLNIVVDNQRLKAPTIDFKEVDRQSSYTNTDGGDGWKLEITGTPEVMEEIEYKMTELEAKKMLSKLAYGFFIGFGVGIFIGLTINYLI